MNDTFLQVLIHIARLMFPGLWLSKIPVKTVVAQARLETGNYKSKSYTMANNLFGMKKPKVRKFHGNGEYLGHASYLTPFHSILDYMEWVRMNQKKLAQAPDYYSFLQACGYAEDKQYVPKLMAIEKSITIVPPASFFATVALFFFVYINF